MIAGAEIRGAKKNMTTKSLAPDASPRDPFASEPPAAFNWPFTCAIAKARVIQKAEYKVGMMIENDAQPVGPPAKDYAGHEKTYRMFLH
jgi:hypothetical protein